VGRLRSLRRRAAVALGVAVTVAAVVLAPGCGEDDTDDSPSLELRVFAAASLLEAFTDLGETHMRAHPAVKVVFNFAGSQSLVAQLEEGAAADVLAVADREYMQSVGDLVEAPQVVATNKLEIAVAPGNPLHVSGLADLARTDLGVILAAPEVPAGKYALAVLRKAGVTVKPVSLEESVKGVVTKVSLGEADAGIVYVTDVMAQDGAVTGVAIPAKYNVTATYPVALVAGLDPF